MSEAKWVLQLIEAVGQILHGEGTYGNYLQSYDPEAHDGRGDATFTADAAQAMKFDSFVAAMACWKQQSKKRPLRPDGKPNRPLTAFSVSPKKIEEK